MGTEHHVYITSSRYGSYAHCQCGESFGPFRRTLGSSFAWACHVAGSVGRNLREVENDG